MPWISDSAFRTTSASYDRRYVIRGLAGAVMCDQDEAWSDARYFSEKVMSALYAEGRPTGTGERPSEEQLEGFRLVAKKAIEASLELADELEAA